MKICHVTSVHSYNDIRISIKECSSLLEANYEVHLVAPNTHLKELEGIHIHGVMNPYKGRVKRVRHFSRYIYSKALEVDAEIYHFHDPELIPIGLKLKKKGKRVIYDIHEDVPRQILTKHWIPKVLRKIIAYSFEKYENKAVKKFDALVAATPHIKKRLKKNNRNTVNVNNYPILNELYDNNQSIIKKEDAVVYIGGITQDRGSVTMVKAIEKTSGLLNLAGKIVNNEEKNKLESISSWEKKVNYLGYVDREQVKGILGKSRAGLVILEPRLNYLDSLPIKMFEYMAAGIPVIASNFPIWKEIIEGNECGICVNPLNVDEIAKAIQLIIDEPEKAAIMGENGRKAVETQYNWEIESKKLIKLYNELS